MNRPPSSNPRTVLYLVDSLGLSGKTKGMVDLVSNLDPNRYRAVVCSFAREETGILAERLRSQGTPVITEYCRDGLNFRIALRLASAMRTIRPAVVHCYNPRPIMYGGLAACIAGVGGRVGSLSAFACQVPDRSYGYLPQQLATVSRKNIYRNRLAVRMVRYLVTVSSIAGDRFFRFNDLPLKKLQVIPYGVDVGLFGRHTPQEVAELRCSIGLKPTDIVVGSVGRLVEEKDYPTQFRAFARAARQDERLHMVVAGNGPLEQPLRDLARELRIEHRVHFLGLWDRVPLLMRALDIFVLASKFETFGVVLIEAKAAGLPVLASNYNEIPDIVRDGKDGMIFPVGDEEKLASLMVGLASDSNRRQALGKNSFEDATHRYSMQAVVGRYQNLYDQVCEG